MNRSDGHMHSVPRRSFRYSPSVDQLPSEFSGLHRRCKRCQGRERSETSARSLGITAGSFLSNQLGNHEIRRFPELGVSKTAIAKITGVSRTALYSFMTTRGLRPSR